jgi:glycosyltransferase involved in cell wall biosynthesis/O-antigen/teichoic acid export membrane protein
MLMLATVANSGLGWIFWLVVSHALPAEGVGAASAVIAATALAALLADLGMRTWIMQELPRCRPARDWSARVSAALLTAGAGALVAGTITVGLLTVLVPKVREVVAGGWAVVPIIATLGATIFGVLDGIATAERRTGSLVLRNGLQSLIKIAVLLLVLAILPSGPRLVVLAVAIAYGIADAFGVLRQLRATHSGWRFRQDGVSALVRRSRGASIRHHLLNLGGQLPVSVLPLAVTGLLSARDNAYFSLTWLVGGAFFMISPAISAALFVEGRWAPAALRAATWRASLLQAALLPPVALVTVLGGRAILGLFGAGYAAHGYALLLVLLAGAVPDAITNLKTGHLRAVGRLSAGAALNLGIGLTAVGLSLLLLPAVGIVGAGLAWLIAQSLGAVWTAWDGWSVRRSAPSPVGRLTLREPGPTRVCVVGSGWRFTSGISYYTCRLTAALGEQYEVSALLMRRLIPARWYPGRARVGQPVNRLNYPEPVPVYDGVDWYWGRSLLDGLRFLRRQRPDVVILQWWTAAVLHTYLVLAVVARWQGARVIIEFHEVQDTGEAAHRAVARYFRIAGRALFSRADSYVVHSKHDRHQVRALLPPGRRRIVVIPHGPFDHHAAAPVPAAEVRAASDPVTTVLFFGTIRPYKGLEHLVEAFSALSARDVGRLRLRIVGETWEGWTGPLELAAASPHRSRIEIVNRYVTDDEVAAHFAAADLVALPYTRSSASGPLHIAMAQGLPVLLTDVGGLRDGAAGYAGVEWVRPNDVTALAAALRRAPDRRGQRFVDPRSWTTTRDGYRALIDSDQDAPRAIGAERLGAA